ncbi:hypothetical protein B0T21DRAFT_47892 [Apiosordaria backusii]|uniref:Uncharacterized protein n=1 Tax=Apiosordaria backusii TaxID=314023 RepID=A0AA40AXZ6_9PEZI|nr:hypothetical protein B0T21DRAFT_47892 [Apiosordaria backusii]
MFTPHPSIHVARYHHLSSKPQPPGPTSCHVSPLLFLCPAVSGVNFLRPSPSHPPNRQHPLSAVRPLSDTNTTLECLTPKSPPPYPKPPVSRPLFPILCPQVLGRSTLDSLCSGLGSRVSGEYPPEAQAAKTTTTVDTHTRRRKRTTAKKKERKKEKSSPNGPPNGRRVYFPEPHTNVHGGHPVPCSCLFGPVACLQGCITV